MTRNITLFKDTFAELEDLLRESLPDSYVYHKYESSRSRGKEWKYAPYSDMLSEWQKKPESYIGQLVNNHYNNFRTLGYVRNTLVHGSNLSTGDKVPLSVPTDEAITILQGLVAKLTSPVLCGDGRFEKDVATCQLDEDLHDVIVRMNEHNYKRLPVLDGRKKLVGVVTESLIMKWIGNQLRKGSSVSVSGLSIVDLGEDMITHPQGDMFEVRDMESKISDIYMLFEEYAQDHKKLGVVIILDEKKDIHTVFTAYDLPLLQEMV